MIRQTCNVRPQDIVTTRSNELLVWLGIEDLDLILKERRLRWYGHVERSSGAVKTAFDIQINGKRGPGRPMMTWKQLTERDCREWKLSAINPHDRHTWRSGVRSTERASQLSGRGPTDVDAAFVLHVNQKSDYDDMTTTVQCQWWYTIVLVKKMLEINNLTYRGHPRGQFGRKSLPKLADFSLSWAEREVKMYRMYWKTKNLDQNISLKSQNCRKTSPSLKALG